MSREAKKSLLGLIKRNLQQKQIPAQTYLDRGDTIIISQKVTRRGIKIYGEEYWDDEMVLHLGEKVNVEINDCEVRVSKLDGTPITTFSKE